MPPSECGECGGSFCWDADAQSAVCLNCGLLEDASQLVLDSQIEAVDDGKPHDRLANTLHPRSTLKSLRSKGGWDLAGQGKAAAFERNKVSSRVNPLQERVEKTDSMDFSFFALLFRMRWPNSPSVSQRE